MSTRRLSRPLHTKKTWKQSPVSSPLTLHHPHHPHHYNLEILVQLQKVYIKPQQLKYGGPLAPWKWVMNRQLQSGLIPPRSSVYRPLFPIKGLLSPGGHGSKMASQTGGWMLSGFMGFWKMLWFVGNISLTGMSGSQQQEVSSVGSSRDSVKPSCYSGGRSLSLMAF